MSSNHKIRYKDDQLGEKGSKFIQTLENLDDLPPTPRADNRIHLNALRQYLKQRIIQHLSSKEASIRPQSHRPAIRSSAQTTASNNIRRKKLDFGSIPSVIQTKPTSNKTNSQSSKSSSITTASTQSIVVPQVINSFLIDSHTKQNPENPPIIKRTGPRSSPSTSKPREEGPSTDPLPQKSSLFVSPDESATGSEDELPRHLSANSIFAPLDSKVDETSFDIDDSSNVVPIGEKKFLPVDITSPVKSNQVSQRRASQIAADQHIQQQYTNGKEHNTPTETPTDPQKLSDIFGIPNENLESVPQPVKPSFIGKHFIVQPAKTHLPRPGLEPNSARHKAEKKPVAGKEEEEENDNNQQDDDGGRDPNGSGDEDYENGEDQKKEEEKDKEHIEDDSEVDDNDEDDDYHGDPSFNSGSLTKYPKRFVVPDDESTVSSSDASEAKKDIESNRRKGLARRRTAAEVRRRKQREYEEEETGSENHSSNEDLFVSAREDSGSEDDEDEIVTNRRRRLKTISKETSSEGSDDYYGAENDFVVDDGDAIIYSTGDEADKILDAIDASNNLKKNRLRLFYRKGQKRDSSLSVEKDSISKSSQENSIKRNNSPPRRSVSRSGIKIVKDPPKKRKVEKAKAAKKDVTLAARSAKTGFIYPSRPESKKAAYVDISDEEESEKTDEEFEVLYKEKVAANQDRVIPPEVDSDSERELAEEIEDIIEVLENGEEQEVMEFEQSLVGKGFISPFGAVEDKDKSGSEKEDRRQVPAESISGIQSLSRDPRLPRIGNPRSQTQQSVSLSKVSPQLQPSRDGKGSQILQVQVPSTQAHLSLSKDPPRSNLGTYSTQRSDELSQPSSTSPQSHLHSSQSAARFDSHPYQLSKSTPTPTQYSSQNLPSSHISLTSAQHQRQGLIKFVPSSTQGSSNYVVSSQSVQPASIDSSAPTNSTTNQPPQESQPVSIATLTQQGIQSSEPQPIATDSVFPTSSEAPKGHSNPKPAYAIISDSDDSDSDSSEDLILIDEDTFKKSFTSAPE